MNIDDLCFPSSFIDSAWTGRNEKSYQSWRAVLLGPIQSNVCLCHHRCYMTEGESKYCLISQMVN